MTVDRPGCVFEQMSDESDDGLIRRCRSELPYNTTSFERLVRRYEPLVFATCRRALPEPADAEEAAQDVFLRVFHGLPGFRRDAAFRTWLFRIVKNECASRLRSIGRRDARRAEFTDQAGEAATPHVAAAFAWPDEWSGRVGEVLDQLSVTDRQVLVLRHVTGLSFEELAGVLQVGLSAAKMRLYRAEERFRSLYPDSSTHAM